MLPGQTKPTKYQRGRHILFQPMQLLRQVHIRCQQKTILCLWDWPKERSLIWSTASVSSLVSALGPFVKAILFVKYLYQDHWRSGQVIQKKIGKCVSMFYMNLADKESSFIFCYLVDVGTQRTADSCRTLSCHRAGNWVSSLVDCPLSYILCLCSFRNVHICVLDLVLNQLEEQMLWPRRPALEQSMWNSKLTTLQWCY